MLGTARKLVLSEADRRRIAYHEAGHAIVGMLTPGADPVRKVSIIPRGQALGVTLSTPEDDRFNYSEDELRAKIRVSIGRPGGRGARVRRDHHRRRVGHPAGHADRPRDGRALGDEREGGLPRGGARATEQDPLLPGAEPVSEATQELVDAEVRRIVDEELRRHPGAARATTARSSTRWPRRCSSARRSTRSTPTRSPASSAAACCRGS